MITVAEIQKRVASRYRLPVEAIFLRCNARDVARPRQIAMYLARRLTNRSLEQLGRSFKRDHTTIVHGVRQIAYLRISESSVDEDVRALLKEFGA